MPFFYNCLYFIPRPGGLRLDRLSSVPGGSRALEGAARRAVRGLVLEPLLCPGKRRGCLRVSGGSGLSRRAGAGELSPELGQALGGAGLEAASWRRYGAGPGTGDPGHRDELRRTWRPRALPRGREGRSSLWGWAPCRSSCRGDAASVAEPGWRGWRNRVYKSEDD